MGGHDDGRTGTFTRLGVRLRKRYRRVCSLLLFNGLGLRGAAPPRHLFPVDEVGVDLKVI